MSRSKALELIRSVTKHQLSLNGYGQCMKHVQFVSADNGNCTAELTIRKEHLNGAGSLHGGCTSTLIDCVSSYALMTTGAGHPGVSVDLHVTFLKGAREGETVTIDAKTIKAGRTMAFLAVEIKKKDDGVVVARGSHTKFIQPPPSS